MAGPSKSMHPFGSAKGIGGFGHARNVQGVSGKAKPPHKIAAPARGAPSLAEKHNRMSDTPGKAPMGPKHSVMNQYKPQRVRPL